jgi:exosortase
MNQGTAAAPLGWLERVKAMPMFSNWAFSFLEAVLWAWSIMVCVPFWQTDDNYAYGWVVPFLMFFFLWRRLGAQPMSFWEDIGRGETGRQIKVAPWLLAIIGLGLFPLEVYREEYFQSGIVLWAINIAKVIFSLLGAWWLGGRSLMTLILFPVLFFLTAVPWPAKIAIPVQQGLMQGVAQVVAEILLWMGVPVNLQGAVLHLSKTTVGVAEACSGIRSLQSGLMVALAVGELLWLSRSRRAWLVCIAIALALFTNLARTFALCWYAEFRGIEVMNAKHDMVGNVAMYSLYVLIFGFGKLFEEKGADIWPASGGPPWSERLKHLKWMHVPDFRPLFFTTLISFAVVHGWYGVLRYQAKPQTEPIYALKTGKDSGNEVLPMEDTVLRALGSDVSERVRLRSSAAPLGTVDASHLFWRPSAMSKLALQHRPDICMPGSGWKQVGEVEKVQIPFNGRMLDWYLFRFDRQTVKALQVWAVWRNGKPVDMDYSNRLTALPEVYHPYPSSRHLMGIELLSVFVPYQGEPAPGIDLVKQLLPLLVEQRRASPETEQAVRLSPPP